LARKTFLKKLNVLCRTSKRKYKNRTLEPILICPILPANKIKRERHEKKEKQLAKYD
jgi:hypothetical protein